MLVIVARFPYTDVTHFYVNYGFYRVLGFMYINRGV